MCASGDNAVGTGEGGCRSTEHKSPPCLWGTCVSCGPVLGRRRCARASCQGRPSGARVAVARRPRRGRGLASAPGVAGSSAGVVSSRALAWTQRKPTDDNSHYVTSVSGIDRVGTGPKVHAIGVPCTPRANSDQPRRSYNASYRGNALAVGGYGACARVRELRPTAGSRCTRSGSSRSP